MHRSMTMDDITRDFITETYEGLQQLEQAILTLESDPTNMDLIRDAFRYLHTIKGTCGFLGFNRMQSVAHRAENVLSKMRDGDLIATDVITSTLFVAIDTIRQIVDAIEATGSESSGNDEDLLQALDKCLKSEAPTPIESTEDPLSDNTETTVETHFEASDTTPATIDNAPPCTPPQIPTPTLSVKNDTAPPETHSASSSSNQSIRINIDVVDNLMALVGELVLTRNQLLQQNESQNDNTQNNVLTRLSHLTTELQQNIMKTRMQPIETAWTKLPRLVRDIAGDLKKKIQVKQVGADTELDRQVIELIKDPLVHMVRNSADHGIEIPDIRKAEGKDETGIITLKSYHHGGHIVIQISDDGKGIDPDVIRQKALEKGVISPGESEQMSNEQILQVVFKAGFSTAESVSNISGRGVGMDVVRSNIEKLGGTIEMQSEKGRGSSFVMKIPLTLSIISVLLIGVSGQIFAIPQLSITEILNFRKKDSDQIEYIQEIPLLRWRGQLLPLIYMSELLNIPSESTKQSQNVIVVQIGHQYFGFIVDSIHDSQEIVVKPLSKKLGHLSTFSGSTILGNGEVVLILDPNNFNLDIDKSHTAIFESQKKTQTSKASKNTIILIFKSNNITKAVPLALVSRIDEIYGKDVQNIYGQCIFHHHDQLIPIIDFEERDYNEDEILPILIFADRGYKLALRIDEIVNIIEDSTEIQLETNNSEILGTAIIEGTATSIIDCQAYFKKAYPQWSERQGNRVLPRPTKRLLLIDDSTFFLNLISPLLKVSGYMISTASSADQGLHLCRGAPDAFDVIISDIEMPDKNGYDFLSELRQDATFDKIPVVALSGCDTDEEIKRCKDAGFMDFVPKTDQQALIRILNEICSA